VNPGSTEVGSTGLLVSFHCHQLSLVDRSSTSDMLETSTVGTEATNSQPALFESVEIRYPSHSPHVFAPIRFHLHEIADPDVLWLCRLASRKEVKLGLMLEMNLTGVIMIRIYAY
jgi:hypothetical protein